MHNEIGDVITIYKVESLFGQASLYSATVEIKAKTVRVLSGGGPFQFKKVVPRENVHFSAQAAIDDWRGAIKSELEILRTRLDDMEKKLARKIVDRTNEHIKKAR